MSRMCSACGCTDLGVVYEGKIRSGGVGSDLIDGFVVVECQKCSLQFLDPFPDISDQYYESDEYREHYDYTVDANELARKYDPEQNDRIQRIGVQNLRGMTVADFGCGVGLFLDIIRGVTDKTIAVEPMETCSQVLRDKGHIHYHKPEMVPPESVDVAVSFDTLEHIPAPNEFIRDIRACLKPGGRLVLSIPNRDDILMRLNSDVFAPFFYCKVHLYYYNLGALVHLLEKNGLTVTTRSGLHKYDFFNLTMWLKEGRPRGRGVLEGFDEAYEIGYKKELIRLGMSSHVYVEAVKK